MQHWRDVAGWCEFEDFYRSQVERCGDGAQFVEIGTWLGRSTCLMGWLIKDSGKRIVFDAVDWGRGDDGVAGDFGHLQACGVTIHQVLAKNLQACGVADYVRVHENDSVSVSHQFPAESVDFCFIDAAHDEDSVTADVAAWLPKMKPGGVIAGHDWGVGTVKRAVRKFFEPQECDGCWLYTVPETNDAPE